MMGFTVFFYSLFEQGGCACGGTVACDKTSVYATSRSGGVGEGGCHHATSRCGNVDKTTNNTTRTSTIIARQQQKHFKNECNQTNKLTNKDQRNKEQRKKQTNTQTTNKKTNTQIDKEQTDTTPPQQTTRAILPTHNNRKNSNNKKTTSDQRVSEGRARMIQPHQRCNSNISSGFARARETRTSTSIVYARARTQ